MTCKSGTRQASNLLPLRISYSKGGSRVEGFGNSVLPEGEVICMSRQLSLADVLVDARLRSNAKLSRIDALIDLSQVEGLAASLRSGETGRPPYAALSMLKALYLQALYDLSDPGLEEALTRPAVVPSLLRLCARFCDAGRDDDLPLSPGGGEGGRAAALPRRGQPAARPTRPDAEEGHADGRLDRGGHS